MSSGDSLSVAVVGPGGVGGLIGGLLSRQGHQVVFVARPATVDALDGRALTVRSDHFGDFDVRARAVTSLDRHVDVCLFTVKAPALPDAIDRTSPTLVDLVVPLLNGADHMRTLDHRFGPDRVAAGAIRVEALRRSSTLVEHRTPFVDIRLASRYADVSAFESGLTAAGVTCTVANDPDGVLWDKLVFLAPFALLTAAHDTAIGPARDEHRDDLRALVDEVNQVGRRRNASLDAYDVMQFIDRLPAAMSSSLRRDVNEGFRDELDAIGGAVIRSARTSGLNVPVTERYMEAVARRREPALR